MNSPKFLTMSSLHERTAGWSATKIGDAKNRFISRAARVEQNNAEVTDRLRGLRSLVQALAEIEGDEMRREEASRTASESRAA